MKIGIKHLLIKLLFFTIFSIACFISEYSTFAMIIVTVSLCLLEYYNFIHKHLNVVTFLKTGIILSIFLLTMTFLFVKSILETKNLVVAVPAIFSIIIFQIFSKHKHQFQNITMTFFPVVHVVIPFILLILSGFITGEYNYKITTGILILICANDIFACLAETITGKHPIVPKVSLKKTWEGFFGGLIFCCAASLLIATQWGIFSYLEWTLLAVIVSFASVFGNLFENQIKNQVVVKGSSMLSNFSTFFMSMFVLYPVLYFIEKVL